MSLFEYFNTTNQTSPHFERHENVVMDIQVPDCGMVQTMEYAERCEFTLGKEECDDDVFLLDYINLLYCKFNPQNAVLFYGVGVPALICVCAYLFLILGVTADGYFCPALKVVSMIMGLSENVAGVTLLAFGNGAPDLFTGFAGLESNTRQLYSDTFSGGMFVVFVVGGLVMVTSPITLPVGTTIRDIGFLLLDVIYIEFAMHFNNCITLYEAIGILGIYGIYILCVIMDQCILKATTKDFEKMKSKHKTSEIDMNLQNKLRSEASVSMRAKSSKGFEDYDKDIKGNASIFYDPENDRNYKLFEQFFKTIIPFRWHEWDDHSTFMRLIIIIIVPVRFLLQVCIPLVDYEIPNHGWSKLLNCLQIAILPYLLVYAILGGQEWYLVNIHFSLWILVVTVPMAVLVFLFTRVDKAPKYHRFLAILGALGSIYIIYACAAETVSVLGVVGITTYRSNSFLGCTMLAWGNSIGDLISNLALSRQGFPKMAFAACFGGPLLNSLIGIGCAYAYLTYQNENGIYLVDLGTYGTNCFFFMAIGLIMVLIGMSSTNCVVRRCLGVIMVLWYILFLFYALLGEFEVMHTYGTNHQLDRKADLAFT